MIPGVWSADDAVDVLKRQIALHPLHIPLAQSSSLLTHLCLQHLSEVKQHCFMNAQSLSIDLLLLCFLSPLSFILTIYLFQWLTFSTADFLLSFNPSLSPSLSLPLSLSLPH